MKVQSLMATWATMSARSLVGADTVTGLFHWSPRFNADSSCASGQGMGEIWCAVSAELRRSGIRPGIESPDLYSRYFVTVKWFLVPSPRKGLSKANY